MTQFLLWDQVVKWFIIYKVFLSEKGVLSYENGQVFA